MKLINDIDTVKGIEFKILEHVVKFCLENNITYYLAYGTLIGAVRHQGFIPWDDDIDIMMPRADYERFIQMYEEEHYKVASYQTNNSYYLPWAKVHDIRTLKIESMNTNRDLELGIDIDIFPIDNLPTDNMDSYLKNMRLLYKLREGSLYSYAGKNIGKKVLSSILHSIGSKKWDHIIEKKAKKYKDDTCMKCAVVVDVYTYNTVIYEKEWFGKGVLLKFENQEFVCPINTHEVLGCGYGNYMELPNEDQRVSHHSYKAYIR